MEGLKRTTVEAPVQPSLHDEPVWAEQLSLRMQALDEIGRQLRTSMGMQPGAEEELVRSYRGIEVEMQDLMSFGRAQGWLA